MSDEGLFAPMPRRSGLQIGVTVIFATVIIAMGFLGARSSQAEEAQKPRVDSPAASSGSSADGEGRARRAELRRRAGEQLEENLSSLGFGPAFFNQFKDREPLGEAEIASLARLLHGLPQVERSTLLDAAGQQAGLDLASRAFATDRGRAYLLRFLPRRVTRQEIPQSLRETLGVDGFYLCEGETGARLLLIAAREIPRAWKLDAPLDDQATAIGLYVKQMPESKPHADDEGGSTGEADATEPVPVLLFAAERIAWHPPTLLAHLGVDYGLFDDVQDRVPLENRDIFYQMLVVASRMAPHYLEYQTRRLLERLREKQARLARIPDLPAKQHAAAERALERADAGASDVVPLFEDPAAHRGEFVILRGEAIRARKTPVDDPRIRERFGVDHYYEVELLTPDSAGRPILCCLAQIPAEMPLGESIQASVHVPGFFLHTHPFATRPSASAAAGANPGQQFAPLVVGTTLTIIPTPKFTIPRQTLTMAAGVLGVLAVCGALMGRALRADRLAAAKCGRQPPSPSEEISLGN